MKTKIAKILFGLLFSSSLLVFKTTPVFADNCKFTLNTTTPTKDGVIPLVVTVTQTTNNNLYFVIIDSLPAGSGHLKSSDQTATSNGQKLTFNMDISHSNLAEGVAELFIVNANDLAHCKYGNQNDDTARIDIRNSVVPAPKKLTLTVEPTPITDNVKTITKIVIGNLERNKTYNVKLHNWTDAMLSDHGNEDWPTGANTAITAVNICNNGNTNRAPGSSEECKYPFKTNIQYGLEVIDKDTGLSVGFVTIQTYSSDIQVPCQGTDCETAIGKISTNPSSFITDVFSIALGIAGGIAFLLMVIGAFRLLTSGGNPDSLNAGRDLITSAVVGLLFITFSVLLLRIIGVNILHIPGFGPTP